MSQTAQRVQKMVQEMAERRKVPGTSEKPAVVPVPTGPDPFEDVTVGPVEPVLPVESVEVSEQALTEEAKEENMAKTQTAVKAAKTSKKASTGTAKKAAKKAGPVKQVKATKAEAGTSRYDAEAICKASGKALKFVTAEAMPNNRYVTLKFAGDVQVRLQPCNLSNDAALKARNVLVEWFNATLG